MACQLPADCLNEIFEYLEKDKYSLHSCLLVNRLWCGVAVRIAWRNIWSSYYNPLISLAILKTLISCLPDESKYLLYTNEIVIPTPTSKPPLLNYISFIKVLTIHTVDQIIEDTLRIQHINTSQSLSDKKYLVLQELLKTFMNQISSLKSLNYRFGSVKMVPNVPF